MSACSPSQLDILCAGSIVRDTIVYPVNEPRWGTTTLVQQIDHFMGGNGANTAAALARLGSKVRLLGVLGADENGQSVRAELQNCGVEISRVAMSAKPSASTIVLVNSAGERQFFHLQGSSVDAFREPLEFTESLVEGAKHFHLASIFVLPQVRVRAAQILADAQAAGLTTSVDVNWDPDGEWISVVEPALTHVDIFFINEDESKMLTGMSEPAEAAGIFHSMGARIVVQKLGSKGCSIYCAGSSPVHCDAYEVACIDTTGAGDCFAAGFLAAFGNGAPLSQCGEWGNAAGALSVSCIGAITGLVAGSRFEDWARETPKRCLRVKRALETDLPS